MTIFIERKGDGIVLELVGDYEIDGKMKQGNVTTIPLTDEEAKEIIKRLTEVTEKSS